MINKLHLVILFFLLLFVQRNITANTISRYSNLPSEYKICLYGDMGTGNLTQYHVIEVLKKENCNQVRLLGDIIYARGINSVNSKEFKRKFEEPFKPFLDDSNGPDLYITLGNHDYEYNPKVWFEAATKFEKVYFPSFFYTDIYGDICITTLDTNKNFKEQLKWLTSYEKIVLSEGCKIKISLGHHPYLSSGMHGNATTELQDFLDKAVIGEADLYLAGHDHQLSHEGTVDKTELFISGSGSDIRPLVGTPSVFGVSKNGYVVLTVERTKSEVALKYSFKSVKVDEKIAVDEFSGVIRPRT